MRFLEKLNTVERVDQLIRMKATGSARDLASRLQISKTTVYEILEVMRGMGAEIDYCKTKRSYYYKVNKVLSIGFIHPQKV